LDGQERLHQGKGGGGVKSALQGPSIGGFVSGNGVDLDIKPDIQLDSRVIKYAPFIGGGLLFLILATAGLSKAGCSNNHTPPGHEGYIRSVPLVGAGEFVGVQKGPTSTGWVWRQRVVNIDVRPRTFSEEMLIVTSDQLELRFRAHARMKPKAGSIAAIVEKFGGEKWYENNVRGPFRGEVRDRVQKLEPFEVKGQMDEIAAGVLDAMQKRFADDPVEFLDVVIGDIQYPKVVVDSVIRKFVTNQDNDRKDIELKIAQRQIDIGIAEAQGIADSQKIIRTTLDPMFLQFEALRAIEELAGSKNTTFLVMPFSKNGNSPVIMNMGN
jgi:hypothetical protein